MKIKLLPIIALATISLSALGVHTNTSAANNLTAGSVISIKLTDGTDYKFVVTQKTDDVYTYVMGLDNACAIPSVACVNRDGEPSTAGTVYNASPLTYSNSLSGQEQTITTQTTNFYNLLPENFKHAAAVRTTNWTMPTVARSTEATTTSGNCSIGDANCTYAAPVFLASYEEWQGSLSGYITEPAANSVGDTWCKARYGADDCKTTEIYKHQNFPWLRTADKDTTERAWSLRGMTGYSLNLDLTRNEGGLLPVMYVKLSNLTVDSGDGSYVSPFAVTSLTATAPENAPNSPSIPNTGTETITQQDGNGHGNSNASVIISVIAAVIGITALISLKISRTQKAKRSK